MNDATAAPRIAILVPSSDTGVELELPRLIGGAASLHVARMRLDSVTPTALRALEANGLEQASWLGQIRPALGLFACTSGTFLRGVDFEHDFVRNLQAAMGAPVVTAAQSMVTALRKRGTRVRLIASYSSDIVEAEAAYLRAHGLLVASATGLGIVDDEETAGVSAERLLHESARLTGDGADVIMLSCTNLRTIAASPLIEHALGLPVVSSNSALAETALHRLVAEA